LKLPPEFISTVTKTFGEDGEQFIADIPAMVDDASTRWELTEIRPVENLSYNFVAFARRGEVLSPRDIISPQTKGRVDPAPTQDVVLKIGVPRDELTSEIAALRLLDGDGACKLIDADEEKGYLLLERVRPGEMLATLEDDDEATRIAARLMKRIWKNQPSQGGVSSKFIQLSSWFDGLKELREMFDGGAGPLDEKVLERVERSVKDFYVENHQPVLMHGDFHHFNILSSERGWLVIDPKGVIGPAGYEVGPLMMNPWGSFSDGIRDRRRVKRRVDILHEELGFERERIIEWSLAHAVLSAWWDMEENSGGGYSSQFAGMMAGIK
jgi:streptomycin 6-kinase